MRKGWRTVLAAAVALSLGGVGGGIALEVVDDEVVSACSCVGFSLAEARERADVVFVGRFVRSDADVVTAGGYSTTSPASYEFEVTGYDETDGDPPLPIASVHSFVAEESCGLAVDVGADWVVFAQRVGIVRQWVDGPGWRAIPDAALFSSLCDGNRPADHTVVAKLGRSMIDPVGIVLGAAAGVAAGAAVGSG